jgi:dihydroorotate dehydrogenase electron transfer subunit
MIWLPEVGEFPMSLSLNYPGEKCSIVVKAMGEGSRILYESKTGQKIGVRGPYGVPFSLPKRSKAILLVAGGTGIAPIIALANSLPKSVKSKIVLAAKTRNEIPMLNQARKILGAENVFPATDDGTLGFRGLAHEQVLDLFNRGKFDLIYSCGPELMMMAVNRIATERHVPVQFSLERIMKCGIAVCGSCCMGDLILCRDGPVVTSNMLERTVEEFGKKKRDKTGSLVSL